MNFDLLENALRSADPTTGDEPVPAAGLTAAAALRRARGPQAPVRAGHRHRWALAVAAAVLAAVAIAVPAVMPESAHKAEAAIRLVAFTPPASQPLPFGIAVAPSGWVLAAAKDGNGTPDVVTLIPPGEGVDSPSSITIMHYPTVNPDFPAGYQGPGPVSSDVSDGRAVVLMQGTDFWAAQVSLPDGSALVLLLPTRMDRAQVQSFLDGVTVREEA